MAKRAGTKGEFVHNGIDRVRRSRGQVDRQLLIRGTQTQIAQIRALLEKMGETESEIAALDAARDGNVRILPITGSAAQNVIDQVQQVWPALRPNRVHPLWRTDHNNNVGINAPEIEYGFEPGGDWVDLTTVHKGGLFGTDYRMLFGDFSAQQRDGCQLAGNETATDD